MNSKSGSDVRTDGGDEGDFSTRLGAIGGLFAGMIIGWSFGMDGIFVGAGVGWVLGNELDSRFEAKANETGSRARVENGRERLEG